MSIVLPEIALEDALLARARQGDQAVLAEIYERYFPAIYQFVRLRVEDKQVAEDISGEVFVTLIDSLGSRKGPRRSLRAWLFQVARNEIFQLYGKMRQFRTTSLDEWVSVPDDGTEMEVDFIRSLNVERARRALQMLVSEQQEVLLLRFGEGLSLQETADVMGKNVGAIKSLQYRAVETLRQILSDMRVENYG